MSKMFADCVVIGGGVIGTAVTYYLSAEGVKPVLVEQDNFNSGASGACDEGIVLQSKKPGILLDMVMKSVELFKDLEKKLSYDIGFRNVGGMIPICQEKHMPVIRALVKKHQEQGLDIKILDEKNTHKQQPGLSKKIIASTFCKNDCSVNPLKLTLGYVIESKRLGAKTLLHNKVTHIQIHKGKVVKVITNEYEINSPAVVDASGYCSSHTGKMAGLDVPVFPVRGQLIVTEKIPSLIKYQIMDPQFIIAKYNPQLIHESEQHPDLNIGLSLSQSNTGNLIIGGCREKVEFDTRTTFTAIREIIKNSIIYFPVLKNVKIIRSFAGLRPCTPDNHPILSRTPIKGFYIASGMGGDGLSLSPLSGRIMSELICSGTSNIIDMKKLSLDRFIPNE